MEENGAIVQSVCFAVEREWGTRRVGTRCRVFEIEVGVLLNVAINLSEATRSFLGWIYFNSIKGKFHSSIPLKYLVATDFGDLRQTAFVHAQEAEKIWLAFPVR